MKFRLIILLIIAASGQQILGQAVPHPVENTGVYEFLDELANAQLIDISSAVKPYSRMYIAGKLNEVREQTGSLNPRQVKELEFYLCDFGKELSDFGDGTGGLLRRFAPRNDSAGNNPGQTANDVTANGQRLTADGGTQNTEPETRNAKPETRNAEPETRNLRYDLFYYKDSLFSLTVNPILGGEMFTNSAGQASYWRNGAEARAYIGKWGFYASLRDNHEKPLLGKPEYLTRRQGGHLKGSTDWSEMRGGVTYQWKWGNIGVVKDGFQWGSNYNGANIFGGNTPTFIQARLQLTPVKWFTFNYFHGWLNSMVVDSAKSYWVTNSYGTDYREVYHNKFISANMYTFTPLKHLNFSAGNSIIYDNQKVNPAFLFPLFFYKSVDHSVSSGIDNMNSQLFFDISSRQIRNLHLYATLFIDELSVSRFTMDDEWNFFSWKTGFRLSNFPVENLSLTTEFTYTYPLVFQHYVPTLTFESNNYNLGHYLKDNSREWYVSLGYKPIRTLSINLWFLDAVRGPDYTELGGSRLGNPPLAAVQWHNTSYGLNASYQLINDVYVWLSASKSNTGGDVRWSPGYFYRDKVTMNGGITVGF